MDRTTRQVRTQKESNQTRGTDKLETTHEQTSHNMERIQLSKGHSPTEECRQTDKSGHEKNPTKQGALTSWRVQTDGQVRTWNESDQARGTHFLESAER